MIGLPRQILELQSNEVLILAQVLAHFKVIGLEPSDVFQAMLASESEVIEVQSDE